MDIDKETLLQIEANNELARLGFGSDDNVKIAPKIIHVPKNNNQVEKNNFSINALKQQAINQNNQPVLPQTKPENIPTEQDRQVFSEQEIIRKPVNIIQEPKIYTVNGSKIKVMPDGKIFTEQWVEILPDSDDFSKIRILAEKTKKPISLSGKIIQMLKWVEAKEPNE
jgi:hypothetical protein